MSDDPGLQPYHDRLDRPSSLADVRQTLAELDALAALSPPPEGLADHQERAFRCMQTLTASNPEEAIPVLVEELLPRCLGPDRVDGGPRQARYADLFGEWLQDLPDSQRLGVCSRALPAAVEGMAGPGLGNALWLVARIGLRTPEVVGGLEQVALRDDDLGDQALETLAALGPYPTSAEASRARARLHARIPVGPRWSLVAAADTLGDACTADLVWEHWLCPPRECPAEPRAVILQDRAVRLLVDIAARCDDVSLTDRTLDRLLSLAGGPPGEHPRVDFTLLPRLDSPRVIGLLYARAVAEAGRRYFFYRPMTECFRPRQTAGWDALDPAQLALAREDAVRPTGMAGRWTTIELDQKRAAWDVLLGRGLVAELPDIDEAARVETSGYSAQVFLELAGCLGGRPLGALVPVLLAGPPPGAGWDEDEHRIAQIGAVRAAHGAATSEAFAALLDRYRPSRPGEVLIAASAALADITGAAVRRGDFTLLVRLLAAAGAGSSADTRGLAAGALDALLKGGDLGPAERERLARIAVDDSLPVYAQRDLLTAFATRPAGEVPPSAVAGAGRILRPLAADPGAPPAPEELRQAAIHLLAVQPGAADDAAFLADQLGLTVTAEGVDAGPVVRSALVAHLVGQFYRASPARFAPAVVTLVRQGRFATLANLLGAIREVGGAGRPQVVDALVEQVRRADDGRVADPDLVDTLAAAAPARLLGDACGGIAGWLPQARSRLADTLARLGELPGELARQRFELLIRLAGDGVFAVRRAAYRAAVACEPEQFPALVESWAVAAGGGGQGLRCRAAEAAGWLSGPLADVTAGLRWDPERAVRDAFRQSSEELGQRAVAESHLRHVLSVETPEGVIRNWRYGLALSRAGDDTTLEQLDRRRREPLPPAVRFWLERVRKAVQRRWDEVVRKWPEPWYTRRGRLEAFRGQVRRPDGTAFDAEGFLWSAHAETPSGLSSWGGWGSGSWVEVSKASLEIPGRHPAEILVTFSQTPAGRFVFSGSGFYPSDS